MKSVSAKTQSQSLHSIIKSRIVTREDRHIKRSSDIVVPSTEETLITLNELGRQRPFCVNFKQKRHDPL